MPILLILFSLFLVSCGEKTPKSQPPVSEDQTKTLPEKKDVNEKDKEGNTALIRAVNKKDLEAIKEVLSQNPDLNLINNNKETALHRAVEVGFEDEALFKSLATYENINAKDRNGNIPLHIAIEKKNKVAIKTLIEEGTDMGITNFFNETPLSLAIDVGIEDEEILNLIVNASR